MRIPTIIYSKRYNRNLNEWSVRRYVDGVYREAETYYTDNEQDADDTITAMKQADAIGSEAYGSNL